jgi:ribonuclease VapC
MNFILDASAVLAAILDEPGALQVYTAMPSAEISTVNLSEVYAKLLERDSDFETTRRVIGSFDLRIRMFDIDTMFEAAKLRPITKSRGLSFADRACAALAMRNDWPILTSDRRLAECGPLLGIDIRMIR